MRLGRNLKENAVYSTPAIGRGVKASKAAALLIVAG